jgi:hypothetical protein
MTHLTRHWHHWLTIIGLVLSGVVAGAGGATALRHLHGGYRQGPLPPPIAISGASPPASHSLVRFLTRTHNQGNSNSCVGQTLSTMVEIIQHERHHHLWRHFSAGYIWNLANGGYDVGISYTAAFYILDTYGDARLRDFAPDGRSSYWVHPTTAVMARARPYRFATYHSIAPTDRPTIEAEIAEGRPVAIAIPVYSSFNTLFGHYRSPPIVDAQSGAFLFWHSLTGVGYTPAGLIVQNSWGPAFGHHGRAILAWSFIAAAGAAVVVATP